MSAQQPVHIRGGRNSHAVLLWLYAEPAMTSMIKTLERSTLHQQQIGLTLTAQRSSDSTAPQNAPSTGVWSYSQRLVSGSDMRIDSIRPPVFKPKVVPRS